MATSTIKYKGCKINDVYLNPTQNKSSYDLKFGRASVKTASRASGSAITVKNATATTVCSITGLSSGHWIIFGTIYWPGGTNTGGMNYRRAQLKYTYPATSETGTIGYAYSRNTPSNYIHVVQTSTTFWIFSQETTIDLVAYQNSGSNTITAYGYLYAYKT